MGILAIFPIIGQILASFFGMKTAQAKTAADVENNRVNAQAGVQEAEGHAPINAIMRAMFAFPFALYYAKIMIWDKLLGWGTTDPLSDHLTYVSFAVIGFYFLTTIRR